MQYRKTANAGARGAPRVLAEDAIFQSLERNEQLAEGVSCVDPELRHRMIATAAYFIAEQRGFVPGHEQQDWYQAEAGIDNQLARILAQE